MKLIRMVWLVCVFAGGCGTPGAASIDWGWSMGYEKDVIWLQDSFLDVVMHGGIKSHHDGDPFEGEGVDAGFLSVSQELGAAFYPGAFDCDTHDTGILHASDSGHSIQPVGFNHDGGLQNFFYRTSSGEGSHAEGIGFFLFLNAPQFNIPEATGPGHGAQVFPGDQVPVPAPLWFFGSCLLGVFFGLSVSFKRMCRTLISLFLSNLGRIKRTPCLPLEGRGISFRAR